MVIASFLRLDYHLDTFPMFALLEKIEIKLDYDITCFITCIFCLYNYFVIIKRYIYFLDLVFVCQALR